MKKTEKIEVRVSAEEKERLTAIADRKGQNVSDLIRDSLNSDIGTGSPYPKWPGLIAIGAILLAGVALFFPYQASPEADRTGNVYIQSANNVTEIDTGLPLDVPYSDLLEFSIDGREYQLAIDVSQPGDGTARAAFDLCERIGENCLSKNISDLTLPIRPSRNKSFGVKARSDTDELLFSVMVHVPEYKPLQKSKD